MKEKSKKEFKELSEEELKNVNGGGSMLHRRYGRVYAKRRNNYPTRVQMLRKCRLILTMCDIRNLTIAMAS